MNFNDYLTTTATLIEQELDLYFKIWRKNAQRISPLLVPLVNASITAAQGGKRIRGMLVKLGYELSGENSSSEIVKVAAAYEIFQTAILAHDDVIDNSPLRRGKPTIFKALGGDHYALSQAICLGDIGFFQAFEIISSTNFPADYKSVALESFAKTMTETALGQMLDIEIPSKNLLRKEQDALTISQLKTARYTISGPLLLGAILSGAKGQLLEEIKQFGDFLGIAYQIQDDILGIFGTEKEVGKSVTSDVEEGKQTLLITKALEKASDKERALLNKVYGKPDVTEAEMEQIRQLFTSTGALDYSKEVALQYVDRAKKSIKELSTKKELQDLLNDIADYLINRNK